jgi:hypothetical protein
LLLVSVSIPVPETLLLGLVRTMILIWGGLVVALSAFNLFDSPAGVRSAWVALTVGAYAALSVPGVVSNPARMAEALAPVAALSLAPHLGRRDLRRALRDWAYVMALAPYWALGAVAMSQVVAGFGLPAFILVVMLPPLITEMLLALRTGTSRRNLRTQVAAAVIATAVAVAIFGFTSLNERTGALVWGIFALAAGLLVGGALFLSLLTMPLMEAAAGMRAGEAGPVGRAGAARAFLELSHSSVLISLAVYLVLRLMTGGYLL